MNRIQLIFSLLSLRVSLPSLLFYAWLNLSLRFSFFLFDLGWLNVQYFMPFLQQVQFAGELNFLVEALLARQAHLDVLNFGQMMEAPTVRKARGGGGGGGKKKKKR